MIGRMRAAALAVVVAATPALVAGTSPADAAKKPPKPPKPAVTKLDPRSGTTLGGTVVTIKGKHLKTAKKVLFGTTKGTGLKVKSDRKLTVVAPAHAKGTVNVTVKTRGGTSAKGSASTFTYAVVRPTVTGLSQSSGPSTGSTRLSVVGTGFSEVSAVTFDGVPGTALSVVSTTRLEITSPEHSARMVHVNVTTPGGTSAVQSYNAFTFLPVPRAVTAPLPADAAAIANVNLSAVSCPLELQCFAAGGFDLTGGVRVPLVERRTGQTTWTATQPVLPSDADLTQDADLRDLDCITTSFCVAVGTYVATGGKTKALVETWTGSGWAPPAPFAMPGNDGGTGVDVLRDVDCATTTSCVAVGRYEEVVGQNARGLIVRWDGTTWTAAEVPRVDSNDLGAELAAVDCSAGNSCVTVGERTQPTNEHLAFTSLFNGTSWTSATLPMPAGAAADPDAHVKSVACGTTMSCFAAGDYLDGAGHILGFVAKGTPAFTGSTAMPLPAGLDPNPDVKVTSLTCVNDDCGGVGTVKAASGRPVPLLIRSGTGGVATELGSLPATTVAAGSEQTAMTSVACLNGSTCIAVGSFQEAPSAFAPIVSALSGVTWSTVRGPVPALTPDSISVDAVTFDERVGVAVGDYSSGGQTQGLILVDLP